MEIEDIDRLLDRVQTYYSSIEPRMYARMVNQNCTRPTLMLLVSTALKSSVHRLNSFGPHPSFLIEAGSSDEGSDEETSFPSIRQVTEMILDSQYTVITVNSTQDTHTHTRYHPPALIIFNIDQRMPIYLAKATLLTIGTGVIKVVPVDFASDSGFIHCGLIYFSSIDEGKILTSPHNVQQAIQVRKTWQVRFHPIKNSRGTNYHEREVVHLPGFGPKSGVDGCNLPRDA